MQWCECVREFACVWLCDKSTYSDWLKPWENEWAGMYEETASVRIHIHTHSWPYTVYLLTVYMQSLSLNIHAWKFMFFIPGISYIWIHQWCMWTAAAQSVVGKLCRQLPVGSLFSIVHIWGCVSMRVTDPGVSKLIIFTDPSLSPAGPLTARVSESEKDRERERQMVWAKRHKGES